MAAPGQAAAGACPHLPRRCLREAHQLLTRTQLQFVNISIQEKPPPATPAMVLDSIAEKSPRSRTCGQIRFDRLHHERALQVAMNAVHQELTLSLAHRVTSRRSRSTPSLEKAETRFVAMNKSQSPVDSDIWHLVSRRRWLASAMPIDTAEVEAAINSTCVPSGARARDRWHASRRSRSGVARRARHSLTRALARRCAADAVLSACATNALQAAMNAVHQELTLNPHTPCDIAPLSQHAFT
jgi:hypothetical protein